MIDSKCNFGELCVSVPNGADVIIGQSIYLTVSLQAEEEIINSIGDIEIIPSIDFFTVKKIKNWAIDEGNVSGSKIFILTINKDLKAETLVTYNVHARSISNPEQDVPGILPLIVNYTTKQFNINPIILNSSPNEYIQPPQDDNPVGTGKIYVTYHGKITDFYNRPLKNTQVIVLSTTSGKLYPYDKALVRIGTEPVNGSESQIIPVNNQNDREFFTVNSDNNGNIKFRIYPKANANGRVDFNTRILSIGGENYSASIYIFNAENDALFGLPVPEILGLQDGDKLEKIPGENEFYVKINPYDNYIVTDSLIFFIQNEITNEIKQLEPISRLDNISSLDAYRFHFKYNVLPLKQPVNIYYIVAPKNGNARYSDKSTVVYIGEQGDHPIRDQDRIYDKVKVYSSAVELPIKVYGESYDIYNIIYNIPEGRSINLDTISHKRKYGQSAKGVVGLYVVIIGTNEKDSKKLPPLGSQGKLTVRVETETSRNTHNSYSFQLPSTPDPGRSTGYCVVNIPYCDVNRAGPSFTQGAGVVVFEYYIEENDGSRKYSKKWRTKIDTVLPNQSDDDPDGCDPLPDNSSYF
ncbi:hypothetical protein BDD26_3400 [Xenorhabdus cabanillasii]|uniref:Uncharacterized protein n=1 Tax=Xenorhabdus cabanillasii TaxID=351673 RepID=A0A3D9UPA6_9GAMM|nr:hypothetical protein [Xenorhabdus cabanillasii]REF28485.1 hypothetical protein BDD26_3400 [Xenorhabdus cabanillasii]